MIEIYRMEQRPITFAYMNLVFKIREHWREIATWTRAYLISKFVGVGYHQEVFSRLYDVPADMGSMFLLLFGNEIADQYVELLSEHVVLLRDYIDSIAAGDEAVANEKYAELYRNADERAAFLSSINPYWDETEWRNMLYTYLNLTFQEVRSFLTGEYRTNISIYDRLITHTENMGDYFTGGMYDYITYNPTQQPLPQPAE
ncbi:MAG: hypothetical protein K0R19_3574 [Bacillota bacterium]|nr:hypothetical protein [Bacillota bacterium]